MKPWRMLVLILLCTFIVLSCRDSPLPCPTPDMDQECQTDEDCDENEFCHNGLCKTRECQQDEDCPATEWCDPETHQCSHMAGDGTLCLRQLYYRPGKEDKLSNQQLVIGTNTLQPLDFRKLLGRQNEAQNLCLELTTGEQNSLSVDVRLGPSKNGQALCSSPNPFEVHCSFNGLTPGELITGGEFVVSTDFAPEFRVSVWLQNGKV